MGTWMLLERRQEERWKKVMEDYNDAPWVDGKKQWPDTSWYHSKMEVKTSASSAYDEYHLVDHLVHWMSDEEFAALTPGAKAALEEVVGSTFPYSWEYHGIPTPCVVTEDNLAELVALFDAINEEGFEGWTEHPNVGDVLTITAWG